MRNERADIALETMDSCRVSWAEVSAVEGPDLVVERPQLILSAGKLALSEPRAMRVSRQLDGRGFVDSVRIGDVVSVHWSWACDVLDAGAPARPAARDPTLARAGQPDHLTRGGLRVAKLLVLWGLEPGGVTPELARAVTRVSEHGKRLEGEGKVVARYHVGQHGAAWIYENPILRGARAAPGPLPGLQLRQPRGAAARRDAAEPTVVAPE